MKTKTKVRRHFRRTKNGTKFVRAHRRTRGGHLASLNVENPFTIRYNLKKKFGIPERVTQDMSKPALVNLYRNKQIQDLDEIKL